MKKEERKMLKEIMIGRGLSKVRKEILDPDAGCPRCGRKTKNLLVDSTILPDGYEGVRGYQRKVEKIRLEAWCIPCALQYYWEDELIEG